MLIITYHLLLMQNQKWRKYKINGFNCFNNWWLFVIRTELNESIYKRKFNYRLLKYYLSFYAGTEISILKKKIYIYMKLIISFVLFAFLAVSFQLFDVDNNNFAWKQKQRHYVYQLSICNYFQPCILMYFEKIIKDLVYPENIKLITLLYFFLATE